MDKEKAELARANFYILRKEAQSILDLVGLLFLLWLFVYNVETKALLVLA